MRPVVAIIGRPNVGKSTLFNRMTRTKDAIVSDMPGVTRDRHYGKAEWDDVTFSVVDTGGYLGNDEDRFAREIRFQVEQAVAHADAILLVLDGKNGISPFDRDLIALLRDVSLPTHYVVNKIDSELQEVALADFYELGLEEPIPVSAEHGYGMNDLMDTLVASLPEIETEPEDERIRIAVIGRPNAGKSSLVNRMIGEDRMVVSSEAGTTRDAIDAVCRRNGREYVLVDTAGIRRKGRVSEKIEKFSVIKALKSLDRCDVALIVLDASEGITDQDITVAGYALEKGCGCVFLLNKWDLVEKDQSTIKLFTEELYRKAKYLSYAPVVTISALTGQRVSRIFEVVEQVYAEYNFRIGTGEFNRLIEDAIMKNEPSIHKGKRIKFYYSTQVGTKPPTFVCFVNYPEAVHFSYQRYLQNRIREGLGLQHTPIRLWMRLRTGKIDFAELRDERPQGRNMGSRHKFSRNKEKKKRERKAQAMRKQERE